MPRPRPSITTARRRRGSSRVAAMTSAAVRSRQPTLAGTRVVEQGTFITGPCAAMMLADLGADVIKIESPDGDPYRSYQGQQYSPHFQAYNRNRRSLALDMKDAKDCELFSGLVREADVYIQNFRPGTAERLGAGATSRCRCSRRWRISRSSLSPHFSRSTRPRPRRTARGSHRPIFSGPPMSG